MRYLSGILAAFAALVLAPVAAAQPLPGGELDATVNGAEVYADTPRAADPPPGPACRAARAYVDNVYAGRFDDIVSLFADDAHIFWPTRQDDGVTYAVHVMHGREEIGAFYGQVISQYRPNAIPVMLLGNDTDCMMEVAAQMPVEGSMRYRIAAINHFTVDESGKIIRLISMQRALSGAPAPGAAR